MRALLNRPVIRVIVIAAIVTLSMVEWIGFPWRQPLVALLAIAVVLGETGTTEPIGLRWPLRARATLAWTVGVTLASIAVSSALEPVFEWLTGIETDYSGYGPLRNNLPLVLRLGAEAWLSAAIGEEIVFRGFLLHELASLMGTSRWRLAAAVALGAVLFGYAHANQELPGVLLTGTLGALAGAAFFASGRNLPALILAHGLVDTWGLYTLYRGWF
jgi:membrane protease YdiL (CAAX protease family)